MLLIPASAVKCPASTFARYSRISLSTDKYKCWPRLLSLILPIYQAIILNLYTLNKMGNQKIMKQSLKTKVSS